MMRQEWFGGPQAEARAVAAQMLSDEKEIPEGAFDDPVDDWSGREASALMPPESSGNCSCSM